jgi:hypothetical protein
VVGAVAGGLALMGTGVQGIGAMDERLERAVKHPSAAGKSGERHDCPVREAAPRSRQV